MNVGKNYGMYEDNPQIALQETKEIIKKLNEEGVKISDY